MPEEGYFIIIGPFTAESYAKMVLKQCPDVDTGSGVTKATLYGTALEFEY